MPTAPLRPCGVPGCPNLVRRGRCTEHALAVSQQRGGSTKAGYDIVWQRLRRVVLSAEPLCGECQAAGLIEASREADHVIPLRARPDLRLWRPNVQGLCKSDHSKKTRAEMDGQPLSAYQIQKRAAVEAIVREEFGELA